MRAVFWKEFVELWLAWLVGLALATVFGIGLGNGAHNDIVMVLVTMLGIEGCVLGSWQARFDRAAAGDEFLRHRPISAVRIHVARGAAGVCALALVVAATFAVMSYVAYREGFDPAGNPVPRWNDRPWWNDLTDMRAAFAVLFALVVWTLARFGGSAARPLAAVFLAPALPIALALLAGRRSGVVWPVTIVIAAGVAAVLLGIANAAERRSAGRS